MAIETTESEEETGLPKLSTAGSPEMQEVPVNVLIVDDDPRNLAALEATLDAPQYRLVRCETADDALRALIADEFALLVLDVRMPEMNGLELARVIKQRKKTQHLPIIFLTAYYQEDNHALLGYDAGAVDYMTKPFNPAVLRSKVAVFAELYRANRALQDEIVIRKVTEQRLAQKSAEVHTLVGQLRALALELSQTEQRERRRLADILHDHMQQLLVSAKMQLASLMRNDLGHNAETVERIESTIQEALKISRSVTVELSPPVLQRGSLREALLWLSERLMDLHQCTVNVHANGYPEPADDDERFLLFECTRELLFNAIKHSETDEVAVDLSADGDQRIKIVVSDAGNGFDTERIFAQKNASFGLFSVQQRLTHLGGALDVQSAPGHGTRATIVAPMQGYNDRSLRLMGPIAK